jgi:large repetitive protein
MGKIRANNKGGDSTGRGRTREHSAHARAAMFAVALASLVFVGSALGVTIQSYAPNAGTVESLPACSGSPITITGTGFVSDGAPVTVKFNGVSATYVGIGSDSTLYTFVPPGATTGPITVTTPAGTATSAGTATHGDGIYNLGAGVFVVSPCEFGTAEALNPVPASISAISPRSGKVGAKLTITITGSLVADVTMVKIGGVAAAHTVVSSSKIIATVPKKAKTGTVSVTTADGSVISAKKFTLVK